VTSQVSQIRDRMRLTGRLSCWAERTSPDSLLVHLVAKGHDDRWLDVSNTEAAGVIAAMATALASPAPEPAKEKP
jgi:hypothetical protein